ncbi:MAG: hypothetical protein JRC68_01020 [Deltaproteobacteria bacterium]|nr:hypothetical protein [Deltaproteobacteria bacterium]
MSIKEGNDYLFKAISKYKGRLDKPGSSTGVRHKVYGKRQEQLLPSAFGLKPY